MKKQESYRTPSTVDHKSNNISLWISLLLFLIYANSLSASWHLDDFTFFLDSQELHWQLINLQTFKDTFFPTADSIRPPRPIASLTLALNWFFSNENVIGYHITNVIFHIITTILLFKTFLRLYDTPILQRKCPSQKTIFGIALFSTLLWSVNPIQVQAVTYIVQRMASLVTLFYLLGILSFLNFRLTTIKRQKIYYIFLFISSYLLALGCKENAALFPVALLLIEFIFFQSCAWTRKYGQTILITGILSIILIFGWVYMINPENFSLLKAYDHRYFTLQERLLTEPRIVLHYLTLIFYPSPDRLSIAHDITLSQSLFSPFSTFISLAGIGFMLIAAIISIKQKPIFSFTILFFFLNHIIESTIIPLELIFEHRNYLPSIFLFWPIVSYIGQFNERCGTRNKLTRVSTLTILTIPVLLFSIGTIERNKAWSTEESLWSDARQKAPSRARPVFNLATVEENKGNYVDALTLYKKSLLLVAASPDRFRPYAFNRIGDLYRKTGQPAQAIQYYQKALKLKPNTAYFQYNLAEVLVAVGNFDAAVKYLRQIIFNKKDASKTHALLGEIYLYAGEHEKARKELAISLQHDKENNSTIEFFALSLLASGNNSEAISVLSELNKRQYQSCATDLMTLTLNIHTDNIPYAMDSARQIISSYPITEIKRGIEHLQKSGIESNLIEKIGALLRNNMQPLYEYQT